MNRRKIEGLRQRLATQSRQVFRWLFSLLFIDLEIIMLIFIDRHLQKRKLPNTQTLNLCLWAKRALQKLCQKVEVALKFMQIHIDTLHVRGRHTNIFMWALLYTSVSVWTKCKNICKCIFTFLFRIHLIGYVAVR